MLCNYGNKYYVILFNDCTVHKHYAPGGLCWLQISKQIFIHDVTLHHMHSDGFSVYV